MKNLSLLLGMALFLAFALPANAQKLKMTKGDLKALKGEKSINTEFTYENMGVGKFKKEAEYVDKKVKEYNEKEKGRGDTWKEAWIADRQNRFEPQFNELFSKYAEMDAGDHPDAKYTLIFNTSFTEPGFNVGVMRKNAYIDGTATIVETANRDKVVAVISVDNSPGRSAGGYDFDTGERISEAYAKAGKELGKMVVKAAKK
ncbi:MAG: hypothetical protein H6577_06680 [Lewinellaceae bacterium]|nr:hypothetical protein [Saprospiraceae bacterium]MCB9337794.1 hypothetical protein [Lewinellaceae bacterium]